MIERQVVEDIVVSHLQGTSGDLYLVDVVVHPGNRIVVELDSDEGVAIDDCVRLTKHIEERLDRDIEDYELEVGSAGLTSPLKVLRQYVATIGHEVEVLCRGGMKERGILLSATEREIAISVVRCIKPEGAKRKQDVEQVLTLSMSEVLQTKRVIRI
ncbi:MAG: ribosome assembly cofactor RimP [Porphyromonadaceae bacterium]|nr:ribosome assembly cofactor RimP [Porphyromonadaceae bacterium]